MLIAVAAIAGGIGWRIGRRGAGTISQKQPAIAAVLFLGLFIAAAATARTYAETDLPLWALAEWFAYGGKWHCILALGWLGIGWVAAAERGPWPWSRRLTVLLALACITATAGWFTFPVYPLAAEHSRRNPCGFIKQSTYYSCGPTCLANYLEVRDGQPCAAERELVRLCGTTIEGTAMTALYRGARRFGIGAAEPKRVPLAELEKTGKPAIIQISTLPDVRHATLLLKLAGTNALLIDPDYGRMVMDRPWLEQVVYGKAIVLE